MTIVALCIALISMAALAASLYSFGYLRRVPPNMRKLVRARPGKNLSLGFIWLCGLAGGCGYFWYPETGLRLMQLFLLLFAAFQIVEAIFQFAALRRLKQDRLPDHEPDAETLDEFLDSALRQLKAIEARAGVSADDEVDDDMTRQMVKGFRVKIAIHGGVAGAFLLLLFAITVL